MRPARKGAAVVTGGTAGVGRAVVDALIARGHRVGVLARGEERLEELQSRFGRDRLLGVSCDVADAGAVSRAAREIGSEFGPPSIWVNAAMLTSYSLFRDMPPEEFEAVVRATFLGQVNGDRAALEVMDRGNIVNVSSGLGYAAVPMQSAYVAAKHAINGFTQSLHAELMHERRPIAISLVQLPAINTPQFGWARNRMEYMPQPAPPIFQPEVAARGVLKAIDEDAREIFVGASTLKMVLGEYAVPWLVDRIAARKGIEAQRSDRPKTQGGRGGNLDAPVPMPSRARGAFDGRAREHALIYDADIARALGFFGVPLAIFGAGMLAGRMTGRRSQGMSRRNPNHVLPSPSGATGRSSRLPRSPDRTGG